MKCVLFNQSVKILSRAIHSLARIGDDMVVEPFKHGLKISTVDKSESAYTQFWFPVTFFYTYKYEDEEKPDDLRLKVSFKAFLTVFKTCHSGDKIVSSCTLQIEKDIPAIIIKMQFTAGYSKTHSLFISDCVPINANYSSSGRNEIVLSSRTLSNALRNFHPHQAEITLAVDSRKTVINNFDDKTLESTGQNIRSQLSLHAAEFTSYRIGLDTAVNFTVREMKAMLAFAENVSGVLKITFDEPTKPIVFNVSEAGMYEANYILATDASESMSNIGGSTGSEASSAVGRPSVPPAERTSINPARDLHTPNSQTPGRVNFSREESSPLPLVSGRASVPLEETSKDCRESSATAVRDRDTSARPLIPELSSTSSSSSVLAAKGRSGIRRVMSSENDEDSGGVEVKRARPNDYGREANNNDGKDREWSGRDEMSRCDVNASGMGNCENHEVSHRNSGRISSKEGRVSDNVGHLSSREGQSSNNKSHVGDHQSRTDDNEGQAQGHMDLLEEDVGNVFDRFIDMETSALGNLNSRSGNTVDRVTNGSGHSVRDAHGISVGYRNARNEREGCSKDRNVRNERDVCARDRKVSSDVTNGTVNGGYVNEDDRVEQMDEGDVGDGSISYGIDRHEFDIGSEIRNGSRCQNQKYTNSKNSNGKSRSSEFDRSRPISSNRNERKTSENRFGSKRRSGSTEQRGVKLIVGSFSDASVDERGLESFSEAELEQFEPVNSGDDLERTGLNPVEVEEVEASQDATLMNVYTPLNPDKMRIVFRHCLEGEGVTEEGRVERGKVLVYNSDEEDS